MGGLPVYDEFDYMNAPMPEMSGGLKRTPELKQTLRSFLAGCGAAFFLLLLLMHKREAI